MVADLDAATLARFWSRVERRGPEECWPWTAYRNPEGYGRFTIRRKHRPSHRVAYEVMVGPIADGLVIDHLCRVRHCTNPAHMEPVTNRENLLRGESPSARCAKVTHCPRGHEYAGDNVRFSVKQGQRKCRACDRLRWGEAHR